MKKNQKDTNKKTKHYRKCMEQKYLEDSYLKEINTKIKKITEQQYLVLEETITYAESGGQPSDEGKIIKNDKEYEIVYAKKMENGISHMLKEKTIELNEGDEIKLILNWEKRYTLMKMHSSAHVLIAAINQINPKIKVTGNQLGEKESRMDINTEELNNEEIQKIEQKANQIIQEEHQIKHRILTKEEAMENQELFKLDGKNPKEMIEKFDIIRTTEIENVDEQIDGGTHVKNTKEIGKIKITKTKNKGKNNKRMYWEIE